MTDYKLSEQFTATAESVEITETAVDNVQGQILRSGKVTYIEGVDPFRHLSTGGGDTSDDEAEEIINFCVGSIKL